MDTKLAIVSYSANEEDAVVVAETTVKATAAAAAAAAYAAETDLVRSNGSVSEG